MSRYFEDVDGYGEPTLWEHDPERPDCPQPVLRRCDIRWEKRDTFWPLLVKAVCG